jgi:nucleotide-binding universal stress UspA family protein
MRKLLVPTDYSNGSMKAFDFACHLAQAIGHEVMLAHVYQMPILSSNVDEKALKHEREKIEEAEFNKLGDFMRKYGESRKSADLHDLHFDLRIAEGEAGDVIGQLAREEDVDLIVMGHKGMTDNPDAVMGSVAVSAVRNTTCPVLIIPDEAEYKMPEHILYAMDLEFCDADVIEALKKFAQRTKSRVTMLYIQSDGHFMGSQQMDSYHRAIDLTMDFENLKIEILEPLDEDGRVDLVNDLEAYASGNNVDMLAVLSRRHAEMPEAFMRGITKAMLTGVRRPLLVFHSTN